VIEAALPKSTHSIAKGQAEKPDHKRRNLEANMERNLEKGKHAEVPGFLQSFPLFTGLQDISWFPSRMLYQSKILINHVKVALR
jgi:hypothetical protein